MKSDSDFPSTDAVPKVADLVEVRLVERLRAGDDDAYRELLQIYGGRLLVVARRLMRDEEDARDCVQDAFLSAFRSIERFEAKAQLGTWLHRVAVNACLTRLRVRKRKRQEIVDPQTAKFDEYGFRNGPSDLHPLSVEDLLEQEEVREKVLEAIDGLPESYRIVLLLRDIEEFSTAETAEKLEMTSGAVKVRLHRARLALKEQIGSLFI
jgi:RNA polymerase sigma-70 factor (ECF subfamily)